MTNYKYKIEYDPFANYKGLLGVKKCETYDDMIKVLGPLTMISRNIYIYQKINGKYEQIRAINTKMHFG